MQRRGAQVRAVFLRERADALAPGRKPGQYKLLAHDDRFGWPDGLAYHDGWLHVTLDQLNHLPTFSDGKELRKPPYLVVRVPANVPTLPN